MRNENEDKKNIKQEAPDTRKNPKPGYDESNPTKKDIQEHPENQHTG